MLKINLTQEELNKLKTVCDYLFFDQYKENSTFSNFEKCFAFLVYGKKISLEKVFKEICGDKRKYITFPRMLKAYLLYKNNPGKTSLDLKNFFSHIFTNVLKTTADSQGPTIQKAKKFTSANCRNKENITKLLVLTDKNNTIKGLKLEYDDAVNVKLYDKRKDKKLIVKLEMLFGLLDETEKQKSIDTFLNAQNECLYRDCITHVFGTFTNKIEFLGFKCRSGKKGFVGKPKGDAFLFGDFGKQFHYLKVQVKSGTVTQFQPFFIDSPRTNVFLKKNLNEIDQEFIMNEPLLYDENHLAKLVDEKQIEKFISSAIVNDDHFFDKNLMDRIAGHDVKEIIEMKPRKWQLDEHVNKKKDDGTLMSLNEILEGAPTTFLKGGKKVKDKKKKDKKKKDKKNKGDASGRGGGKERNEHKKKDKEKKEKQKKEKKEKDKDKDKQETKEKKKQKPKLLRSKAKPRGRGRLQENTWNGVSTKNLRGNQILSNKDNYLKLLEKMGNDIKEEIANEYKKINKKKKDFYDNFSNKKKESKEDQQQQQQKNTKKVPNVEKLQKDFEQIKEKGDQQRKVLRSRAGNPKRGLAAEITSLPTPQDNNKSYTVTTNVNRTKKNEPTKLRSKNLKAQPITYRSNQRGLFDSIWFDDPFSNRNNSNYSVFTVFDDDNDDDDFFSSDPFNDFKKNYFDTTYRGYDDPFSIFFDDAYGKKGKDKNNNKNKGYYEEYVYEDTKPKKEEKRREEKKKQTDNDNKPNNNNNNRKGGYTIFNYVENPVKADPAADKRAQGNWKKITEKMEKDQGLKIFQTIAAVLKAIRVLTNSEESLFDGSVSLKDKIRLYQILEENQHIVDFLSQPKDTNDKYEYVDDNEAKIIYEDEEDDYDYDNAEHEDEEPVDDEEEEEDEETQLIEQFNTNIQNLTLDELNKRIDSIEKVFQTADDDKKEQLNELYEKYIQRKNELIEEEEEKAKQEVVRDNKINVKDIVKEEEEKRKKLMLEESNYIKDLQKKTLDMVEEIKQQDAEDEARGGKKRKRGKQHEGVSQEVSIHSKPAPNRIYRNQQLYKGKTPFTDPLFPPEQSSLCPTDGRGNWILPPDAWEEDVEGWENFKWCRAEEIFGSKDYQVFHDGIKAEDIIQGALGDCYWLSAIAALCKFPKLIEKLFYTKEKTEEHCYGVYYNINGVWELVLVDDYVPYTGRYAKKFAFSSANGNELWVVLAEKAWAKINGCYAKVGCGGLPQEVFDVITEAYSQRFDISAKFADKIWNGLLKGQEMGYIMTAGTSADTANLDIEENGLVPGHAYTILGVYEISSGVKTRLVRIRNPWGAGEWSGDWSDNSSLWTNAIRRQVGIDSKRKDDGEFFMSFEDFLTYFCMMGICQLHNDYIYNVIKIEPEEVHRPSISKITVNGNNVHTFVKLYQKNPRIILKDGTYQDLVITWMMLVDKDYHYIASTASSETILCIEQHLNKGTYYLVADINYRYVQKNMHGYRVSTYASEIVGIEAVTDKLEVYPILKKAVAEYARANLEPAKEYGGAVTTYISKAYSQHFPFVISLFENNSKNDITVDYNVKSRGAKSFAFYCEDVSDSATSMSKTIKPKDYDIFMILQYTMSSMFSFSYDINAQMDEDNLESTVFSEQPEPLDDEETIIQYVHEERNGYIIGLENKRRSKFRMKLETEGLEFKEKEYQGKSTVYFEIGPKERKVFNVKVKKNYTGDITFGFNFA